MWDVKCFFVEKNSGSLRDPELEAWCLMLLGPGAGQPELEAWRLWLNSLKNFSHFRTYAAGNSSRGRIKYQLRSLCLILFIVFIFVWCFKCIKDMIFFNSVSDPHHRTFVQPIVKFIWHWACFIHNYSFLNSSYTIPDQLSRNLAFSITASACC